MLPAISVGTARTTVRPPPLPTAPESVYLLYPYSVAISSCFVDVLAHYSILVSVSLIPLQR
ncbi:hypothetical protein C8Q76DRAFT_746458 [Earliella scabrosa]|nr:hypothetical protein C8Q76DRAFT_746458 [Earliella scabrosa]